MKRDHLLISRIMAKIRSKGTGPEIQLQSAMRALKHRALLHPSDLPGQPDFAFPRKRVAVFVDGDFWHGRQWKTRGLRSLACQFSHSKNRTYWIQKITRNVRRDRCVSRQLRKLGWHVVRLWGSDLNVKPDRCVQRIKRVLERAS